MRDIAATHISRCIRGWLARKKYHRALHALREWRNQETTHFRNHVIVWVANQEIIQKKVGICRIQLCCVDIHFMIVFVMELYVSISISRIITKAEYMNFMNRMDVFLPNKYIFF